MGGRTLEQSPIGRELRAVTGAFPGPVRSVPAHEASEVGATRGQRVELPTIVSVNG